jgi:hypothetical protein
VLHKTTIAVQLLYNKSGILDRIQTKLYSIKPSFFNYQFKKQNFGDVSANSLAFETFDFGRILMTGLHCICLNIDAADVKKKRREEVNEGLSSRAALH